jgi:uncharacterized membrane protein
MPNYAFAVISALAWALSAQFVNFGLRHIPKQTKVPAVLTGLLISLSVGTSVLILLAGSSITQAHARWELVVAGILTFPVGTALYYLCGHAFGGRMEFASQFANIKPLLTILAAITFLGEGLTEVALVSFLFLLAGIGALILGTVRGVFSWTALILGFLLAGSWASGEVFIKLGMGNVPSLPATIVALASGTVVGFIFIAPYVLGNNDVLRNAKVWGWAFAGHGMFSFIVAYPAFFESIRRIGLAQTIMINSFWPALAVGLAWIIARMQRRPEPLPTLMVVALISLLAGSFIQILAISE